eukprot:1327722-Pleurochrysis_carterae.AAC.1
MGDLRLDVGHEERSSKELPGVAYEHVGLGLLPLTDCFFEREEAAVESSPNREESAPMAAVSTDEETGHSEESPPGDVESVGTAKRTCAAAEAGAPRDDDTRGGRQAD